MTRTMSLPVPVGSLESYIQAVNRFPLLSFEEERDLARKFRSENDVEAARQLVLSHLRLVVAIARGYMGYGLPQGDLIQEGNIGLMKAVKRFDPERGVRLVSFAVHWIRAEIHEFVLRNWRMVKVATTKAQRKLFFNLRSMKPTLAPLTQTEIGSMSRQLRVKPEEVAEMEMRLAGQEISLEPASDEDEPYAPIAYLADRSPEPSEIVETKQDESLRARGLETALASLDARSRRIIEARWLREKDSATLHELAAEFKVSAERIRQIEAKALAKMKDVMAAA
ncbi:MAG: RNA polymerase sigma factor RpoH [Betaproteobacteria bacterium]|nr:MAG: RNA polymerase sigma factor RpoH [Betaproteobacteria bacterium]TMH77730.1 MAG: RNA polymerase sigma factor RpoH [Betaproteobacteria bacterium]